MAVNVVVPLSYPKKLSADANLAKLLPTGTVLTFQTFIPQFSNNGSCLVAHKYLTLSLILFCSLSCFFFSFTDSFLGTITSSSISTNTTTKPKRKLKPNLYYGIATFKGFYIFNKDIELAEEALDKFKIRKIDFVHAFLSLMVFLVFASSSVDVKFCLFPDAGANANALMMNLPIGVSAVVSFLFTVFPTKRRGVGYADRKPSITEETLAPNSETTSNHHAAKAEANGNGNNETDVPPVPAGHHTNGELGISIV